MKTQLLKPVLDSVASVEMTVKFLTLTHDGHSSLRT